MKSGITADSFARWSEYRAPTNTHSYIEYPGEDEGKISKMSTIENSSNEDDILSKEDVYADLQGLNSDNLMQFSQQSAIQQIMLKEVKPNLDVLPTLEEHDIGGYKFQLNLNMKQKGKVSWTYSNALNKVYIKMNDICSIDAVYTPKIPLQELRIRALMCFGKEVSTPVVRCPNHISSDDEPDELIRHSLMRCENPTTEYYGKADGRNINDRYSIIIPLGICGLPKNDNSVHQTIALKFTCQNSCIRRRETSIVFLLESVNGEILSQRVLDVKVCSCPKRDKDIDERNLRTLKRKVSEEPYSCPKKARRKVPHNDIKQEISTSDLEENNDFPTRKEFDIEQTPSGGYRMVMEFDSLDMAMENIQFTLMSVAAKVLMDPEVAHRHKRNYRRVMRLRDKAMRLKHLRN